MPNTQSPAINSDLPIMSRTEDKYSFSPFASNSVSHIFENEQPESLIVGLSGEWGSGKTSYLNLIEEELKNKEQGSPTPITVRYVPWRVKNRESLLNNFLPMLVEYINLEAEKSSNWTNVLSERFEHVKTYAKALEFFDSGLKPIAKVLSATGLPVAEKVHEIYTDVRTALDMKKTPDIEKLYKKAYESLLQLKIPVVVMIDDVDRLEPLEIVNMFRLVRATTQLPYITFIISYDQSHVMNAVDKVLGINGQQYLEKIIQLPISVPPIDHGVLYDDFSRLLEQIFENVTDSQIEEDKSEQIPEDLIHSIENIFAIETPRDIVRIINTINYRVNSDFKSYNFENNVYFSILQSKSPLVYDWLNKFIQRNRDRLFSQSVTGKTKYSFSELKDLKLVTNYQYSGIVEILEKILPTLKFEKLL